MNKKIIGITGHIGSGKTEVGKYFKKHNGFLIEADKIVHSLYKKNAPGWKLVKKNFSKDFFNTNGSLNRKKLGKFVFTNPPELKKLEKIIHPLVENKILKLIENNNKTLIIIESIKFPQKIKKIINKTILIRSPEDKIIKRLEKKYDKNLIEKILLQQNPPKKADFIINNTGSLKELEKKSKKIIKSI